MRWKASAWLTIAFLVMTKGHVISIDNDLNQPRPVEIATESVNIATLPEPPINEEIQVDIPSLEKNNHSPGGEPVPECSPDDDDDCVDSEEEEEEKDESEEDSPAVSEEDKKEPEEISIPESSSQEDAIKPEPSNEEIDPEESMENVDIEEQKAGKPIQTDHGLVQGYYLRKSSQIRMFVDIPYGKFEKPFEPPKHPADWDEIHEVFDHKERCPQLDDEDHYVGDTSCLTLTVFSPTEGENMSVLFHIHDGNFATGSGDPLIYGPDHLVRKDVILVLPNYRLGPLGFLCLQNEIASGNAALKDLTLALDWVKRNIEAFGGNPGNIFISGDGTSGALVGYLVLSSKSRPYINGAITESGSVLSHWAIDRDPASTASKLAKAIGGGSRDETVFENTELEKLVQASKNIIFKPCIEKEGEHAFITKTPWALLHDDDKENIPFMIGAANHAGMRQALEHTSKTLSQLNNNFSSFLPNDLKFDGTEDKTEVSDQVKKQYFGDATISLNLRDELSLCYTDALYFGPVIRTARNLMDSGATVYVYEFSFVGDLNRELHSIADPLDGAARGDIIGYIFCQDGQIPEPGTKEAEMVEMMTDLWTSFINTGQPRAKSVCWNKLRQVNDSDEQWLSIGTEDVFSLEGLHLDRLRLWTDIYHNHFVDNWAPTFRPALVCVLMTILCLAFHIIY